MNLKLFEKIHFSHGKNGYKLRKKKKKKKKKKMDRVGSLDACFQQVLLVQNFWKFRSFVMEH